MESSSFRFDDTGLQNLLKALEGDHVVRIGVFGGAMHKEPGEKRKIGSDAGRQGGRKSSRKSSDQTQAEIGFLLEYGAPQKGIPARSWLRMPIMTKMNNIVKDSARGFSEVTKSGDLVKFLTIVGINAEKWIGLAFDTRGFGSWQANAPATIEAKGSDTPNIDTSEFRRAVTSMVV